MNYLEIANFFDTKSTECPAEYWKLYPPLKIQEIAKIESRIGFELPLLMKYLYSNLSNGLSGSALGLNIQGRCKGSYHCIGLYEKFEADENLNPRWPKGLLPIMYWGDVIFSSVDCRDSRFRIVRHDPNNDPNEIEVNIPEIYKFEIPNLFECSWVENESFDKYISDFTNNKNLYMSAYSLFQKPQNERQQTELDIL